MGFPGGSVEKNLPVRQETWCSIPGSGRSLDKELANCSSILAWEIPWTEEPGRNSPWGCKRVRHDLTTKPPPYNHK